MEFCLGVQPFMQPQPKKNPGGDCFACALTAALRHLFPEDQVQFETAWNYFMVETVSGGQALSNTWPGMRSALYAASGDGYRMEITADIVRPEWEPERFSHMWFWQTPVMEYNHRLEGWLRSGWVALTEVNFAGAGPVSPEGRINHNDHFVLVDGVRSAWEPVAAVRGAKALTNYVHVVCSAKGPYWIKTDDFLTKHGAAAWWLARRNDL